MSNIDFILKKRGETYGDFEDFSFICQSFKAILHGSDDWLSLPDDIREALEMISHKMSIILNGSATHVDSWTGIIIYATLVEKRLKNEQIKLEEMKNAGI